MIVGNLSAVAQTNVKRMLAYSSIAHVGYLLMGFVVMTPESMTAVIFYLIAYCGMNLGAFWIVGMVHDLKNGSDLKHFSGTGWQMPLIGVCMAMFLLS